MSYDYACGYRRPQSAAERELDERWHAAIYDESLQAYLREYTTYFELDPPKRKPPPRRCTCGQLITRHRAVYCDDCKPLVTLENNRRWLRGETQKHEPCRRRRRRLG